MRAIQKKIQSQRGASITFALLLFLVCAVLSSVVIVAATTASGRMSRLAETDQRYYAVTSAAELLRDVMKEKTVSIVKVTKSYSTVTYRDGVPEETVQNQNGAAAAEPTTEEYIIANFEKTRASEIVEADLPADCKVKTGNDLTKLRIENTAGYSYLKNQVQNKTLILKPASKREGMDEDALEVTVAARFAGDGSIRFSFAETGSLVVELSANAEVNSDTRYEEESVAYAEEPDEEDESVIHTVETVVTVTTAIELTAISWDNSGS